jgi:O-antigen ligase
MLGMAIVVCWAVLQAVPLPRSIVSVLAPATGALYDQIEAATGLGGARPLSIEPMATLRAALLGASYLAVFVVAATLGRRRRLAARLALAVAMVGAVVALFAVARIAELPVEDPWQQRPREPFLNPNHLCTFLIPCLTLGLGVALSPAAFSDRSGSQWSQALSRRGLAGISVVPIVVGLFLSQSRGGLVSASIAIVFTVLLSLGTRPSSSMSRSGRRVHPLVRYRLQALGLGLALAALGAGFLSADRSALSERFEQLERVTPDAGLSIGGRVALWKLAGRVIATRPLGGSGLGTFDDASFSALTEDDAQFIHTRPESAHNDYLELGSDLGVPMALLALGCVLLVVVGTGLRLRHATGVQRSVGAGVVGGTLGVLAHGVVEFGLQIPGPALLFSACLGLGWGLTCPEASTPRLLPRRLRFALRIGVGLGLAAVGLVWAVQASAEADGAARYAQARDPELGRELRESLGVKADAALSAATGDLGVATAFHQRADVQLLGPTPDSALAEAFAREAAARAPLRGQTQMLLAYLLLERSWRDLEGDEARRAQAEGEARLALALELGSTNTQILLLAARLEIDLFAHDGQPEHLERATDQLLRVLRRKPSLRGRVESLLSRREARLGAAGAALRSALGLDR